MHYEDSITVVSALTRSVESTLLSAAFFNTASFRASIAPGPQRDMIFFNVDGSGTAPPNGIRQNRDQLTESHTSRHSTPKPSL